MIEQAIMQRLAAQNGGPGLTVAELATGLHRDRASIRNALAELIFRRKQITCERPTGTKAADARYRIGDPAPLLRVGT